MYLVDYDCTLATGVGYNLAQRLLDGAAYDYEDLRAAGVIDPAKVARVALENAASIAGMFLTTECLIVDKPDEKAPVMPAQPGMM